MYHGFYSREIRQKPIILERDDDDLKREKGKFEMDIRSGELRTEKGALTSLQSTSSAPQFSIDMSQQILSQLAGPGLIGTRPPN